MPRQQHKPAEDAVLDVLKEGVLITDQRGTVTFGNEAAKQMLGYGDQELVGKMHYLVFSLQDEAGDTLPLKRHVFERVLEGERVTVGPEDRLYALRKDRSRFPVMFTASPLVENGAEVGGMIVFHELHPRAEDNAVDFMSMASHQIRTPLTVANLYVDMLLAGHAGELLPEQREYIEEISFYNQKMRDVLSEFLTAAKIEMGRFVVDSKPTDLAGKAAEAVHETQAEFRRKDIALETKYDPALPLVEVDPEVVRMVLRHLLSNAAKFTSDGGRVCLSLRKKRDHALLQVADTGIGIADEEKPKIFNKLYRGEHPDQKKTSGVGFGLYIVKSLLDLCGCDLSFESEVGKGTTFSIKIPFRA